jgi:hypothetical protein
MCTHDVAHVASSLPNQVTHRWSFPAVMPGTRMQEHSGNEKSIVWSAVDFADEEQRTEMFCARFASQERESWIVTLQKAAVCVLAKALHLYKNLQHFCVLPCPHLPEASLGNVAMFCPMVKPRSCHATGAQEFMREHEKAMEHNDKVLAQQEGEGAEVRACSVATLVPIIAHAAGQACEGLLATSTDIGISTASQKHKGFRRLKVAVRRQRPGRAARQMRRRRRSKLPMPMHSQSRCGQCPLKTVLCPWLM